MMNKSSKISNTIKIETNIPTALTIAGSDSGGCAGIQADIKTFSALKVFGMSAITSITAQNTINVVDVHPIPPKIVSLQIDQVLSDIGADAIKSGMLYSKSIIEVVADRLSYWAPEHYVLDPVMISSTGSKLLKTDAIDLMVGKLFPLASMITPNIPEAEALLGYSIETSDDIKKACKDFIKNFNVKSVLLKGGHFRTAETNSADDIWYNGGDFHTFSSEWVDTSNVHGTGCTYASAITAYLALGHTELESIRLAKNYIFTAIKTSNKYKVGSGDGPVNHFWMHN